jgi:hypothetical protein
MPFSGSPNPSREHMRSSRRRAWRRWSGSRRPDLQVSVNLRDLCDGLGLDVGRVQGAALRVVAGANLPAIGQGRRPPAAE